MLHELRLNSGGQLYTLVRDVGSDLGGFPAFPSRAALNLASEIGLPSHLPMGDRYQVPEPAFDLGLGYGRRKLLPLISLLVKTFCRGISCAARSF